MGRVPFPAWLPTVSGEPRVASPVRLFSATYKPLFQQLLCFVIYPKHPGVTLPLSFGQRLGSGNAPPCPLSLRRPTSRSQSLKTRRIISLRASGANHGSRQEKQIAEIRRQDQQSRWQTEWQTKRQAGRQIQLCSAREQGQGCSHRRRCCNSTRERSANRRSLERRRVFLSLAEIYWPSQSERPGDGRTFQREEFSGMFSRVCRTAALGSV